MGQGHRRTQAGRGGLAHEAAVRAERTRQGAVQMSAGENVPANQTARVEAPAWKHVSVLSALQQATHGDSAFCPAHAPS